MDALDGLSVCTERRVIHMLPEGPPVVGVTSLGKEIYLLRVKECVDAVEVYDVISYRKLRRLTVPYAHSFTDMTSCKRFLCLYICDPSDQCIHRLDIQGSHTKWPVNDTPYCLSVSACHSLIVTCRRVRKLKEFSPRGELLRDFTLPHDVVSPRHTIQLTSGQFIVCHGDRGHPIHRVCKVSKDGGRIIDSHGGQQGSDIGHCDGPSHLAVDDNEFVFVVDVNNRQVTLLSPALDYIRQVVSCDQVNWEPRRLCLDVQRRHLYVAENKLLDGEFTAGRVVVYSV